MPNEYSWSGGTGDYNWVQPGNYDWIQDGAEVGGGDAGPQPNPANTMFSFGSMAPIWANETGFTGSPTIPVGSWDDPSQSTNPEYLQYLQNNGYTFAPGYNGGGTLSSLFKGGQYQGTKQVTGGDQPFGTVMNTLGSMFLGGPMGPGATLGLTGGAAGALGGGIQGGMTGGAQGALRGAVQGGLGGSNPAGMVGIENRDLSNIFNSGVGNTVGALTNGASGQQALQAGLGGVLTTGLNSAGSFVGDLFNQFGGDEFGNLPGNMVTGNDPYNAIPEMYSDEGARFDNSADFSYGYRPQGAEVGLNQTDQNLFSSFNTPGFNAPQQQPTGYSPMSSFSTPSMSDVGGFVGNNLGNIVTGLYDVYNNRRQQKGISNQINSVQQANTQNNADMQKWYDQNNTAMQNWYNQNTAANQTAMQSLQDLYSNNSPYATQLRNKITAQAAASGRRANTAGRETQLQAALADKYASVLPQITNIQNQQNGLQAQLAAQQNAQLAAMMQQRNSQMPALAQLNLQAQQQRGTLQNSLMNDLLHLGNKTGAFNSLANMFNSKGPADTYDLSGYNDGGGY